MQIVLCGFACQALLVNDQTSGSSGWRSKQIYMPAFVLVPSSRLIEIPK